MKNILKRAFRFFFQNRSNGGRLEFANSRSYWEQRYRSGRNSGPGSYSNLAEFKSETLNGFVSKNKIESVIEFGCGDGNQLRYFRFGSYIGLDISDKSIDLCRETFKNDRSKKFLHYDSLSGESADLGLSLDVIYHLVEDDVFEDYMTKLFDSANRFVIIYSSNCLAVEGAEITKHVKHRRFTDWIEKERDDFKLIKYIPNRYPFRAGDESTSFADFFVFERRIGIND